MTCIGTPMAGKPTPTRTGSQCAGWLVSVALCNVRCGVSRRLCHRCSPLSCTSHHTCCAITLTFVYPAFSGTATPCPSAFPHSVAGAANLPGQICWTTTDASARGCKDWCLKPEFESANPGGHLKNCPDNVCASTGESCCICALKQPLCTAMSR